MKISKSLFGALLSIIGLLLLICIPSVYYSLHYMHWYSQSHGYDDLYLQKEYYQLELAPTLLIESSNWTRIASDPQDDGGIRNWSDAMTLSMLQSNDTLWVRYDLYNNIDINEPMISLALDVDGDPNNGINWHGTTSNFGYDMMIATGYVREGTNYKGYNFIDKNIGACTFLYDLENNSYFLGLPMKDIQKFEGARFVASVGNKGLWNDDIGGVNIFTLSNW